MKEIFIMAGLVSFKDIRDHHGIRVKNLRLDIYAIMIIFQLKH